MSPKLRLGLAADRRAARPGASTLPTRGHVVVAVGAAEYGLDARRVRHLLPATPGETLPGEVRFLGRGYPVRDLRAMFGAGGDVPARRFLLLVEGDRQHSALVVDAVAGLLRVDESGVLPLPAAFTGRERRRFAGLLRRGDHVVPLLDPDGVWS